MSGVAIAAVFGLPYATARTHTEPLVITSGA
jgi:hypothetical protein